MSKENWSCVGRIWSGGQPVVRLSLLRDLAPGNLLLLDFNNICDDGTPAVHNILNEYLGFLTKDAGLEAVKRYKSGEAIFAKVLSPVIKGPKVGRLTYFKKAEILVWSESNEIEVHQENSTFEIA